MFKNFSKFKKHHIIEFSGTCKQRDRRRLKTRRTHNIILRLVSKIATTLQNLKNIFGIPVYLVFRLLRENNSPIFSLMGLLLLSTCPCVHRPDERLCSQCLRSQHGVCLCKVGIIRFTTKNSVFVLTHNRYFAEEKKTAI